MNKKIVVMTGATSGFGVAWLKALVERIDADFFILARSESKFKQLIASVNTEKKQCIHLVNCELDAFDSIRQAVRVVQEKVKKIDLLINNAGVFPNQTQAFSQDGVELTLAVNHLAPFLLTTLLKEQLIASPSSRVVNTASFQHYPAKLNVNDLAFSKTVFNAMQAYQQSKLCNVIFTKRLALLLKDTNVTVNCFDPGIVDTSMTRSTLNGFLNAIYPALRLFFLSPEKGAETGIYLSLSHQVERHTGGYYRKKCLKTPSKLANSEELATALWAKTEQYLASKIVNVGLAIK